MSLWFSCLSSRLSRLPAFRSALPVNPNLAAGRTKCELVAQHHWGAHPRRDNRLSPGVAEKLMILQRSADHKPTPAQVYQPGSQLRMIRKLRDC